MTGKNTTKKALSLLCETTFQLWRHSTMTKRIWNTQTVKLLLPAGDMYITNIYSPPFTPLSLNIHSPRHLTVGDFDCHSPSWGSASMDKRGKELEDWMIENQRILINKPDGTPTFFLRAWKSLFTPNLAMATDDIHSLTERSVHIQLGDSDHVPVIINISTEGCLTHSKRLSWDLKRANWDQYSQNTDTMTK
ncbi:hypothetical protein ElyMa_004844400 [Elysia marginata]|uniref:Endonuclease/exonuclease/phosphatase domain-containing protein n=1 Tax=Elysia marginata TaxID=1093978 RepID=A0AAV4INU4_9GAST|nr:hypothetical protein ElyMa_004844400 [Elysia marginata]